MTVSDERVSNPERRVRELGLTLPVDMPPAGSYAKFVRNGELLWLSGHLPDSGGTPLYMGKLGRELTTAQGYEAARQATICLLGSIRNAVGDLDRVQRVLKLFGMVNSTEDFTEQTQVINGASDLLADVFGDIGLHARSAVGMAQLPRNNCVEIEAVVVLAPDTATSSPFPTKGRS
jgi:enamine deaminase RidA (YjgF/YER057c/UK114 family)